MDSSNPYLLKQMNMKNILLTVVLFLTLNLYSQCDVTSMTCCSIEYIDTLDYSEYTTIYTTPHVSITPPAGYAVRLVKPTVMKIYSDGLTLGFSSGESVNIENDDTPYSGNYLGQFGDSFFYHDGIYSSSYWHSYRCMYNGEITQNPSPTFSFGNIYLRSTYPITGGGTDAKLIFIFTYELVPY